LEGVEIMIKVEDGKLLLNDETYYDLKTTTLNRIKQGVDAQLEDGSLTKEEYNKCIELVNAFSKETELTISRKRLLEDFKSFIKTPKDYIDEKINSYCKNAISYLESLSIKTLSEAEIDKAFDIAANRI
jgi:polyhydroxyalkanoate synthesis regulator phasin